VHEDRFRDVGDQEIARGVTGGRDGGVLVTDVGREGRMLGADRDRFAALAANTRHALIAAGGIAGPEDLRTLAESGIAGAVLGMALYTGAVDARAAARDYAS
jgi:phosphoribosylformimino-5-aminoimidazole carboxamide ribotide isomerase